MHRAADEVTSGGASFVTVVQAADFGRVADSGNLAGQIDRVSSLLLPGNNAFTPVLTAVRSSQSQRLKLILWHLNKT